MCGRRVECPQAQHHNCGASVSTSSSSAVRDDVTEARGRGAGRRVKPNDFIRTVVHPYTHEQQHQVLTTKCRVPLPSLEALDPTGLDALSILFSALGMQQSESLLKSDGDTRGGRQRHPTVTPPHLLCKQASMSRSSTSSGNFMLYLFSHSSSKTNRWVVSLNIK